MKKFKIATQVTVKKLKCKNCGKEVIVTNNGEVEQKFMVDYVIEDQLCEDCGCNFHEVEYSIAFNTKEEK